jgi:peptide/nickel transport system permease protein
MAADATGAALPLALPAESPPAAGFFRRAWRVGRRRPPALIGAAVVTVFVLLAVGAPWVAPFDPVATSWSQVRKAPTWAHPFGTDDLGRDGLSRVIWGTRISMLAGVCSILFAIGAIGLVTILGPSLVNATLAIGVGAMPTYVRLTRGLVLSTKEEDYVQGARALGAGDVRVMARHILPNVTSTIIVQATVQIPTAIIAEAVLSFLGLGVQPPAPSWGTMLNAAQQFLEQAPWMAIWPGAAIFLLALSFNLAGDGLRDILDPRDY